MISWKELLKLAEIERAKVEISSFFDMVSADYSEMIKDMSATKAQYQQNIAVLVKETEKLQESIKEINPATEQGQKSLQEMSKQADISAESYRVLTDKLKQHEAEIKKLKEEKRKLATKAKDINNINKEAISLEAQLGRATGKNAEENAELRVQLQEKKKALKENAREALGLISVYQKESRRLNELRKRYKDVALVQGENSRGARELRKQINALDTKLKKVDASAGQFQRNVGAYNNSVTRFVANLKQLLLTYISIAAAQRALSTLFEDTKSLNALDQAFKAVIDDQKELAETQLFLKQISEDYGLELLSLSKAYLKFSASTKNTNLEGQKTRDIFDSIAKSAAILQLSTEETDGALRALGQIISKGKVQAEELRGQLGDRLPGAFRIMADAIGVSTSVLDKMLEQGQLMADDILPLFAEKMEEAFGADQVERIETLQGSQNRLRNSFTALIDKIDSSDFLRSLIDGLTGSVKWVTENIRVIANLAKGVGLAAAAYLTWKAGVMLTNFAMRLNLGWAVRLATSQGVYTAATTLATRATIAFNTALRANPAGIVLTAITAVAGALLLFRDNADEAAEGQEGFNDELERTENILARKQFEKLKSEIDALAVSVGAVQTKIGKLDFKKPVDEVEEFTKKIKGVNSTALSGIQGFLEDEIVKSTTKLQDTPEELREVANKVVSEYAELAQSLVNENGELIEGATEAYDSFLSALGQSAEKLGVQGKDILEVAQLIKDQDLQKKFLEEINAELERQAEIREKLRKKIQGNQKEKKKEIDIDKEIISTIADDRERELAFLTLEFERKRVLWEKYGLDVSLLVDKFNRDRAAINKKYDDAEAKALQEQLEAEYEALEKQYKERERLRREAIINELSLEELRVLEQQRVANRAQANTRDEIEHKKALEIIAVLGLRDLQIKQAEFEIENEELLAAEKERIRKEAADAITDIENNAASERENIFLQELQNIQEGAFQVSGILAGIEQRGINREEARLQELEERKQRELELVGDNAREREAIERRFSRQQEKIENEQRKRERRIAISEKAVATSQSIINTALAVTKQLAKGNLGGAVAVGILGALQTAAIIAQPIPQFKDGTPEGGHKGGLAIVGDGGKRELMFANGKAYLSPDKPTLVDLPRGAQVMDGITTERALREGAERNNRAASEIQKSVHRDRAAIASKHMQLAMSQQGEGIGDGIKKGMEGMTVHQTIIKDGKITEVVRKGNTIIEDWQNQNSY